MRFIVISPGYNATSWADFNIGSVLGQKEVEFCQVIIDDGSLSSINNTYQKLDTIHIIKTKEKRGALASHIDAMDYISDFAKDEDVIVHLDLDDWLLHPMSLCIVKKQYEEGAWATYGNYLSTDGENSICKPYLKKFNRKTDTFHWFFSHLRTFKYSVYKQINKESLIDGRTGLPFEMAGDVAICSSILELCPVEKVKFIQNPLMLYNRMSTLNENKVSMNIQQHCVLGIRDKPAHKEL